jgi:hypothetical protein
MKHILVCLVLLAGSCSTPEKRIDDSRVSEKGTDPEYFEGRIPLDEHSSLYLEISLKPSIVQGEGKYLLRESIERPGEPEIRETTGIYSAAVHEDGSTIITLHGSARTTRLTRTYTTPSRKTRTEAFRNTDLTLRRDGDRKLIVLDDNSNLISSAYHHNLLKRSPDIFTVEGYFRHKEDTAEFYEMNTQTKWPLTQFGAYMDAARQYYRIATKKNEPIYLKGTAFVIEQDTPGNKRIRALVFKRILQTSSVSAE